MTTTADTISHYHSIFAHFPLILFTAALVTDLLNYFGKSKAFAAGHWLIILGVLACIPTITTGLAAAVPLDPKEYFLEQHRYLGFVTAISGSLYAGLRISAMLWNLPLKPVHYVGASILLVALVSWVSDYGFLIPQQS